jgi:DNA polymerase elongation subunit (family B)
MSQDNSPNVSDYINKYVDYVKEKAKYGINPVTALDYSSLYPSLIMAYNLSPEYLVTDVERKNNLIEKGFDLHEIDFVYNFEDSYGNKRSKNIIGWTVRHDEGIESGNTRFGLYPEILKELFRQRFEMKKYLSIYKKKKEHMEKEFAGTNQLKDNAEYQDCLFQLQYCDTKQKALKVYMNCFYGELGNKNSPLFILELAGGITSAGQYNLRKVKKFIEDKKCKTYYGDSVVGETPIIIKQNNLKDVLSIEELFVLNTEKIPAVIDERTGTKEIIDSTHLNLEVITDSGWSKIVKIIRHKTDKQLYRITTHIGSVIVTKDHSLINIDKQKIAPEDCNVGTELLHWNSEGECFLEDDSIRNFDYSSFLEGSYQKYKRVPICILNGTNESKLDFLRDCYMEYGDKEFNRFYIEGQILAQGVITLLHDLGYNTSITTGFCVYTISFTKNKQKENIYKIKRIEKINSTCDYVYDLETESHHFGAGVGQIVVHNTDSLYFTFSDESFVDIHKSYLLTNYEVKRYKEDYCTALVDRTFKMVKEMTILVNNFLRQDNGTGYLKMAYEEVLYPVVFLARKKYYGIAHEGVVNFSPEDIFIKGLEVKKRGISELLKIVCMELMWETMNIFNYKTLRELVMHKIDYLYSREWKMEEFIQTGLWKPNKKNQTLIRYVNRLLSEGRDPPDPYERFNYVIVKITDPMRLYDFKGRKIDIKKGDKMEYIEYAQKNNLEIDLDYYFEKQISGQFARLISYDDEFHVYSDKKCDSEWEEIESTMEIEDDKTMKVCRKFIKEYATKWNGGYSDLANVYKSVYRYADRLINDKKKSIISKDKQLGIMVDYREEDGNNDSSLDTNLDSVVDYRKIVVERVERIVMDIKFRQSVEQYSKDSVKGFEKTSINVTKMYCKNKNSYLTKMLKAIHIDYEKNINEFIKFCKDNNIDSIIFKSNQNNLTPMIQNIRNKISEGIISIDSSEEDITSVMKDYMSLEDNRHIEKEELNNLLKQAYSIFVNIVSIKRNEMIHNSIHDFNQKRITNSDVPKRIKGFRL